MNNELFKRIATSLLLILLLFLMFANLYVLIVSLIIISIIAFIEFNSLLVRILPKKKLKQFLLNYHSIL